MSYVQHLVREQITNDLLNASSNEEGWSGYKAVKHPQDVLNSWQIQQIYFTPKAYHGNNYDYQSTGNEG